MKNKNNFKTFVKKVAAVLDRRDLEELLPTGAASTIGDLLSNSRHGIRSGMAHALAEANERGSGEKLPLSVKSPLTTSILSSLGGSLGGAALGAIAGSAIPSGNKDANILGSGAIGMGTGALLGALIPAIIRNSTYRSIKDRVIDKKLNYKNIIGDRKRGILAFGDRPFDYGALSIRKILKNKKNGKPVNYADIPVTEVSYLENLPYIGSPIALGLNAWHGSKAKDLNDVD